MKNESPLEAAMFLNEVTIDLRNPILHLYDLCLLAHGTVLFKDYMFVAVFFFLRSRLFVLSPSLTEQKDVLSERSHDMLPLNSESYNDSYHIPVTWHHKYQFVDLVMASFLSFLSLYM